MFCKFMWNVALVEVLLESKAHLYLFIDKYEIGYKFAMLVIVLWLAMMNWICMFGLYKHDHCEWAGVHPMVVGFVLFEIHIIHWHHGGSGA